MPIKSLETYLFERGLVGAYPIESLKNSTLGIDINHYVSRLLSYKKEQFLDAIGGFPTSLKMYLESDLKIFKEYKITPIFIFNGSMTYNQLESNGYFNASAAEASASSNLEISLGSGSPPGSSTPKTSKELLLAQRHRGWTQWSNLMTSNQSSYIDQPIQPQEPFRYNSVIELKRYQSDLINYFIDHDIVYQVAPYCSWIQLAYLYDNGYIDAIYGPTDCLLLKNIEKFILGMEFPNKDFRFIDKTKVLKDFQCTHEDFIDIAMAVGNDLQSSTLPPLQIYPNSKIFDIALEMFLSTGTNFYAYQLSNPIKEESDKYRQRYEKGVSSLKFMPVLKTNGKVELYTYDGDNSGTSSINDNDNNNNDNDSATNIKHKKDTVSTSPSSSSSSTHEIQSDIPNDVHDFIAQQLPSEYYFYRSLGLVTGKLFDAISTGIYPEEPPLDGGSSDSYRELLKLSVDMFKNKDINLLTQPINRYFQMKQIKQIKWFSPNYPTSLINRTSPSLFEKINRIIVKTQDKEKQFSIAELIKLLSESSDISADFVSEEVIFPNSVPMEKKLSTSFDLLSTSMLRVLTQLEFFDFNIPTKSLKPTKLGSVLLNLPKLSIDDKHYDSILLLLIFLKTKVMSLSEDVKPSVRSALSDVTLRTYPQESQYILLITRILTLFQINQRPTNYHGPIDKKTLIFREHLDFIRENMNEIYEATLISSLTANEFDRLSLDNFEWQSKVVRNMPFKLATPNTIMAMMWEFFLQKYLHNGNVKTDALALVATEFGTYKSVPNLNEQFEHSYEYLMQILKVLKELNAIGLFDRKDLKIVEEALEFCSNAIKEQEN
ncbi:Mkt1p NDAI_0B04010 [Naumovozyma dairenensis CBS 421]|uniref:XPG N-terminal domain-containing protein n=1 Tax=Naumovozyma dairenensis (strain ATCC 10597 / BCRC 20456 / CBS 421 / NBRC 0211 / NRRL Y-12639) TaxID=1071378 RepID=G0W6M4_NAUDC|nr:hypothetical protein NDAI_0B04010 [Naumovozyma dairenensis CBS 421]CCD23435.1 hypothetical protein NDAI_0B04010 [Naumovozyma dairenensis CBS 421]